MRISVLAVSLLSMYGPGAAFGQSSIGIMTTAPSVSCSDIHSAPDCSARPGAGGGLGSARTTPLNRTSPVAIGGGTVSTGTTGTRSTIGAPRTASGGIGTSRPAVSALGVSGGVGTLLPTIPTPRAVGPLGTMPGTTDGSSVGTTGTTRGVGPLPPIAPNSPSEDELDELLDGGSSSGGVQ